MIFYFLLFAFLFVTGCMLFVACISLKRMLREGGLTRFWTVIGYMGDGLFLVFDFALNVLHILVCLQWRGPLLSNRVEQTLRELRHAGPLSYLETWQLMVARWWFRQIVQIDGKHFHLE